MVFSLVGNVASRPGPWPCRGYGGLSARTRLMNPEAVFYYHENFALHSG
jgi:hypothetical protein